MYIYIYIYSYPVPQKKKAKPWMCCSARGLKLKNVWWNAMDVHLLETDQESLLNRVSLHERGSEGGGGFGPSPGGLCGSWGGILSDTLGHVQGSQHLLEYGPLHIRPSKVGFLEVTA